MKYLPFLIVLLSGCSVVQTYDGTGRLLAECRASGLRGHCIGSANPKDLSNGPVEPAPLSMRNPSVNQILGLFITGQDVILKLDDGSEIKGKFEHPFYPGDSKVHLISENKTIEIWREKIKTVMMIAQ